MTAESAGADPAPLFRLVAEREVFRNKYITVYDDDVSSVDGDWSGRYLRIVESGGRPGVAILASCEDRFALVRVYRYPLAEWEWGIPRGFAHGDDPVDSARQELVEEIGAAPDSLVSIGRVAPNSGILASRVELYFARYASEVASPHDPYEVAEVRWITAASMLREIAEGRITDAFTLSALTAATARGIFSP